MQKNVITVRMDPSLHEDLKKEAHSHKMSLNKLCLHKLKSPAGNVSEKVFLQQLSDRVTQVTDADNAPLGSIILYDNGEYRWRQSEPSITPGQMLGVIDRINFLKERRRLSQESLRSKSFRGMGE